MLSTLASNALARWNLLSVVPSSVEPASLPLPPSPSLPLLPVLLHSPPFRHSLQTSTLTSSFPSPSSLPPLPPSPIMAPPVSGLRGTYNTNLRSRDEWGRIGPMITALGTMTETFPRTSGRDFSFELTCHFPPVQTFDASRLVRTVNVNALLLSPAHFQVKHRRDTGTTIQQFAESNKRSASVILYLMDSSSSGAQQIEATQALGALHHCLSLGIADPPPVLVISDASYLLDCVEGFMRSLSRVIHLDSKASAFGQVSWSHIILG